MTSLFTRTESPRILFNRTVDEAILIGINSIFIVAIVSTFIGAVTCVQVAYNLNNAFIPRSTIGFMVREMTILELAPTITSIVLAGKVGSSIAGGLGTMQITEQVDALEVMGQRPFDVVLLDLLMPGMNGIATCRQLKAHPAVRSIPVIFLTSANDVAERLEGFASHFGADFYGLPRNTSTITLVKEDQVIPESLDYLDGEQIIPLYAGKTIQWRKV